MSGKELLGIDISEIKVFSFTKVYFNMPKPQMRPILDFRSLRVKLLCCNSIKTISTIENTAFGDGLVTSCISEIFWLSVTPTKYKIHVAPINRFLYSTKLDKLK